MTVKWAISKGGHWHCHADATSTGDDNFRMLKTNLVDADPTTPSVIVDGVSVNVVSQAAGTARRIYPIVGGTLYLGGFPLAVSSFDGRTYTPLNFRLDLSLVTSIGWVIVSNSELNDIVWMDIWGRWLPVNEPEPGVQPVSLEGYRWPLQRRY